LNKRENKNIVAFRQDAEFFFHIGLKHADHARFGAALRYLRKSVELEPYNTDYQFNMACVLSELKESKDSNDILHNIIYNMDPTFSDCYFGMGCNYFDMNELDKAQESFERYLSHDPDGPFADDAQDIIFYLQIYNKPETAVRKRRVLARLLKEGKRFMEEGDHNRALASFDRVLEMDPDGVEVRNELAVACFMSGDVDRAMSLANSVLKLEPENINAWCNLILFYSQTGNQELYGESIEVLSQITIQTQKDFIKLFFILLSMQELECAEQMISNYTGDFNALGKVLTQALESKHLNDSMRATVKRLLQKIHTLANCRLVYGGESKLVAFRRSRPVRWLKEWEEVIDCAIRNREYIYQNGYRGELKRIWMDFIRNVCRERFPVIRKKEIWAAALEYIYCNLHRIQVSKKKLAVKYKVSEASISYRLKRFHTEGGK
jgi:tetratricopeptide (TPR) repeat protein